MTTPPPPKSVWAQLSLNRLTWIGVVVVLVTTAAFGGLDAVERVTPVSLGQTYDDGPLRITPHSAEVRASVPGMRDLDQACRYLVVDVTIESVTDRSVALPNAFPVIGTESDCKGGEFEKTQDVISIHGIPASFKGAVRLRDGQPMPALEPGFTNEFRLIWAVPAADLADRPEISMRMPQMSEFISTFRIVESWGGDKDGYGSLTLTPAVYE
ncbi:hypothetical protein [Mycobacterium sp. 236(2023)]|uniref:hypothetical protein n=1 Tax=Mycobacterium sp. 236(2023) TaxID=3038163 RepID=UPI0024158481|nr:hypothetical protein [Mycobacterium sp. 236(2023)]MDG4663381.1 hypothetical protein [Mycobacterium sp. 236(2023)]